MVVDVLKQKSVPQIQSTPLKNDKKNSDNKRPLQKYFWAGIGALATYKLFDDGLANFLNLETLTHGTGPKGFVGISLFGADPNYGGGSTGSSQGADSEYFKNNSKRYFHVFKDTEFIQTEYRVDIWGSAMLPRHHAILSGIANFGATTNDLTSKPIQVLLGSILGAATPTLKFRFRPEDVLDCVLNCRFENDEDYRSGTMAYKTSQPISALHLGVTGTLSQGINAGMFKRMASNPYKVLKGVALLISACYVGAATYRYFKKKPSEKNEPIKTQEEQPSKPLLVKPTWKETTKKISKSCLWGAIALGVVVI